MITWNVVPDTAEVYLDFVGSPFGRCKLWMPEGIATPRGLAGVYPRGMRWRQTGRRLRQDARSGHVFGPGNVTETEPGVLECAGIRYAKELPLPWRSSFRFAGTRVDFSLSVHNPHGTAIPDVAALICFKFMEAAWWSPASCSMATDEGIKTIAQMHWIDGRHPSFQKWHIGPGSPYDNPVLNGIWTPNPVRAISPLWVVRHDQGGYSLVISGESAYYIHCNRGNPCNDLALKFGDMAPGQRRVRSGRIEVCKDTAENIFRNG